MLFKIIETGKVYDVSAREWDDEYNQYKPDCFDDIAQWDISQLTYPPEPWDDTYLITRYNFNNMVDWWENEFDNWKQGFSDNGECFDPIDIQLFVKEVE